MRTVKILLVAAVAALVTACSGSTSPTSIGTATSVSPPASSWARATVVKPSPQLYRSINNTSDQLLELEKGIAGEVRVVCETGDAVERFYGVAVPRNQVVGDQQNLQEVPNHPGKVIGYNNQQHFELKDKTGLPLAQCPAP